MMFNITSYCIPIRTDFIYIHIYIYLNSGNAGKAVKKLDFTYIAGKNAKFHPSKQFLKKVNIYPP